MKNPLVSVIIPSYNRAALIKKAVLSVLEQTYGNIEVIVVDDGSTDKTAEVISKITDKRLRFFKLPKNQGACHARNYGIKKAKGELICFNDSDDVYLENKIERQVENLLKNKSDMDICRVKFFDGDFSIVRPTDDEIRAIKKHGYFKQLLMGNYISNQSPLIKKSLLKKASFDEKLSRLQDYDLWIRLLPQCKKISITNEALVHAYLSKDSISKKQDKLLGAVRIMLTKGYKIDDEGRKNLNDYLLLLYRNSYLSTIWERDQEIEQLRNDNALLLENNQKLVTDNKKLIEDLNNILNSKTWRTAEKVRKILRR